MEFPRRTLAGLSITAGGVAIRFGMVPLAVLLWLAAGYLVFTVFRERKRERPQRPPRGVDTVARNQKVGEALEKLEASRGGVLVIAGNSGVGKSVLCRQIEKIERRRKRAVISHRDYSDPGVEGLKGQIESVGETEQVLFILDQLEDVFRIAKGSELMALKCVSRLLDRCRELPGCRCLLVIRREWFMDLLVFPQLAAILKDSMLLGGFDPEQEKEAHQAFRKKLIQSLGGNEDLVEAVIEDVKGLRRADLYYTLEPANIADATSATVERQVVPVEAAAVVDALRYQRRLGRSLTAEQYRARGGLRQAMREYFQAFVDASGAPAAGTRVLAALSVDPRARRALSEEDLAWITSVPAEEVHRVVEFFRQRGPAGEDEGSPGRTDDSGLLRTVEEPRVDWVHDFFAERFNEVGSSLSMGESWFLGGRLLDPIERDNMVHFWEVHESEDNLEELTNLRETSGEERVWSLSLFWATVVLLWGRALIYPIAAKVGEHFPPFLPHGVFSMGPLHPVGFVTSKLVDISFLPVAISLTLWSWYTTTLYRRVFSRLTDGRWRGGEWRPSRWSFTVMLLSSLLVLLSCLFPRLWVAFMGLGGFAVGLRYFFVGRGMRERRREAGAFFGQAGAGTMVNTVICLAVGVPYAFALALYSSDADGSVRMWMSVALLAIMVYFAVWVTRAHCGMNRAYVILGSFRRYWRRAKRLGGSRETAPEAREGADG